VKGQYYGKYRGTVVANEDPMMIGRLMVIVPDVSNIIPSTWAMPCLPFAGIQNGFYAVPAIGSGVWVEYEQGDPDYPIWTGCFFGTPAETPALALATPPGLQAIVIQTVGQNTLMISDTPGPTGGILLKAQSGAMISLSDTGIIMSNGQGATILMQETTVIVNEGALMVQ
jgi:uncharacterized protein involved in type VI secretion and phage assembly